MVLETILFIAEGILIIYLVSLELSFCYCIYKTFEMLTKKNE